MLKKIVIALLAAGAVASNAPAASASHQSVGCRYVAVSNPTVTGVDTWEGVAIGYIVGDPGEPVSIRCVVRVGGSVRAATDWGTGVAGVTVTSGRVTYTKSSSAVAQICAQYTTSHGGGETCFAAAGTEIPPQQVADAVDAVPTRRSARSSRA